MRLALVFVLLGCGARTGLESPPGMDAGVFPDVSIPDAPGADVVHCRTAADCDDGLACTEEACIGPGGLCFWETHDTVCDDGRTCSGAERCVPGAPRADARGCVAGTPVTCGDGVECTADVCDEAIDACAFLPEVARCPISHRCDPARGCVARALAHDATFLYEIDLPSGDLNLLGTLPVPLTDLALNADGTLYGPAAGFLYRVDYVGGTAMEVATVPGVFNALDFAPDGTLYGAVDDQAVVIDPASGTTRAVARFPGGLRTSGDVAFIDGRLFATTDRGAPTDYLVAVDPAAGTAALVGPIGERCVWGLAPLGDVLYGLTCEGTLLRIDRTTGVGTVLRRIAASFYGAGAR